MLLGNSGEVVNRVGSASVIVVVVGLMFYVVRCHAKSKGAKLSYDLDYVVSFW